MKCDRITSVSAKGLDLIKEFEGFKSAPYLDIAKVPTIGYGSTYYENGTRVTMKDKPIDEGRAESLLRSVVSIFEKEVDAMTRDDVSQAQFDALVSFAYNLGASALKGSTLLKKVNAKPSDPDIRAEFAKWVYAAGRRVNGLIRRRELEANLYFS